MLRSIPTSNYHAPLMATYIDRVKFCLSGTGKFHLMRINSWYCFIWCEPPYFAIIVSLSYFFSWLDSPSGPRHPVWGFLITLSQWTLWDSSGRVIGPSQGSLPDNTQHSQETDGRDPRGIRTHNPSKRAAADPRLRPHGHWDRH